MDEDGGTLTFNLESSPTNGTAEQGYSSVLDFDGSNDYVKLPDMSYLNDFSFSAWFKIDSRNYWERIFDFGKGGQGDVFLTTMGGRSGGNMELTGMILFLMDKWSRSEYIKTPYRQVKYKKFIMVVGTSTLDQTQEDTSHHLI